MKKFLLFSCLMLSISVCISAQFYKRQLISPAADYFAAGDIQMTWVLGDLITGAYDIGQLIVPFGVDVPPDDGLSSVVTLFPNPATDMVYLQINMSEITNCHYNLYDILGREIKNGNITSDLTELSLSQLAYGVYLLRIMQENNLLQEFKIIKQ